MPDKREPNAEDQNEAKKIILGQSTIFVFDETGFLCMPNAKKPSHEYSQANRSVQAALVDLLLIHDPKGERFIVAAKEALTDQMKAIADSFSDMSDDHPANTLAFIDEDMRLFSEQDDERKSQWISLWADVLRCEKKHVNDEDIEGVFPVEQYRQEFLTAFTFFDACKTQIEACAIEKEKAVIIREKYDGLPPELRASDGFWDSVRITLHATPALLTEVRQAISQSIHSPKDRGIAPNP